MIPHLTQYSDELRLYMLDLLPENRAIELEEALFEAEDRTDLIESTELDLMTDKLLNRLTAEEEKQFEEVFLASEARQEMFARYATELPGLQHLLIKTEGSGSPAAVRLRRALNAFLAGIPVPLLFRGAFARLGNVFDPFSGSMNPFVSIPEAAYCGTFADSDPLPFEYSQRFPQGLSVRLEEVQTAELHVVASAPADGTTTQRIRVSLIGETGELLMVELELVPSGDFAAGRASIGLLSNTRNLLGTEISVLVARLDS